MQFHATAIQIGTIPHRMQPEYLPDGIDLRDLGPVDLRFVRVHGHPIGKQRDMLSGQIAALEGRLYLRKPVGQSARVSICVL
nr:hypothetical protein [Neolewinella xylanilytica]